MNLLRNIYWHWKNALMRALECSVDRLFPTLLTRRSSVEDGTLFVLSPRRGQSYNGSILQHEGGFILCYRHEWWPLERFLYALSAKQLKCTWSKACFLDSDFRQKGRTFCLAIPGNTAQDPRLFRYRNSIYVLYSDLDG